MSCHFVALEELERDALTELVNIGVGRAAFSLRKMVGEQVLLSVPSLEVVTRTGAGRLVHERESGKLVAVRQDFEGVFCGRALLIFPEANSMALVHAVTGGVLSGAEAAAMEDEALAETGNVVLNGCLATMANMLKQPLSMSLPKIIKSDGFSLFDVDPAVEKSGIVLFLYINFQIDGHNIRGYIAMLMDLPSLEALRLLIADFIQRVTEGEM